MLFLEPFVIVRWKFTPECQSTHSFFHQGNLVKKKNIGWTKATRFVTVDLPGSSIIFWWNLLTLLRTCNKQFEKWFSIHYSRLLWFAYLCAPESPVLALKPTRWWHLKVELLGHKESSLVSGLISVQMDWREWAKSLLVFPPCEHATINPFLKDFFERWC